MQDCVHRSVQIVSFFSYTIGCPPADEITLLHSELLLLQSEVLFERHKCILHATRNRRLVGRVFQTNVVKEELSAIVSCGGGGIISHIFIPTVCNIKCIWLMHGAKTVSAATVLPLTTKLRS